MIKVCGMREPENIEQIAALPIDLMGGIFYHKSARFLGDRTDSATAFRNLPNSVKSVGVFVNSEFSYLKEMQEMFALDYLQLHGNETPEQCREASKITPVIKAFGLHDTFDFSQLTPYSEVVDLFIFDTSTKGYGGSGKKFNWEILNQYNGTTPFLLSGGLSQDDSESVNAISHPQLVGVDLNSGFEISPALKSASDLALFIPKLRVFI